MICRLRTALAAALFLFLLPTWLFAQDSILRAHVWEYRDSKTNATGAASLLRKARLTVSPLPMDKSPAKLGSHLIVLGSFSSEHPGYEAYMDRYRSDLLAWVKRGGVLVQFSQDGEVEANPPFLPQGCRAPRGEGDFDGIRVLKKQHPLFAGRMASRDNPPILRIPSHLHRGPNWNWFDQPTGFEVLAASSAQGLEIPAILEKSYGKGRILLCSLFLDKLYDGQGRRLGGEPMEDAALNFFFNLGDYAWMVKEGREVVAAELDLASPGDPADDLEEDEGPTLLEARIRGSVYWDQNRNGQRDSGEIPAQGIWLSDGRRLWRCTPEGKFEQTVDNQGSGLLWLRVPENASLQSPFWKVLDFSDARVGAAATLEMEFGLWPLSSEQQQLYRQAEKFFLYGSELGLRDRQGKTALMQDIAEAKQRAPQALFWVFGGELVQGVSKEKLFGLYQEALQELEVPIRHVPGPSDLARLGASQFRRRFGPECSSWDLPGYRCLAIGGSWEAAKPWLQAELEALETRRKAILFVFEPPQAEDLEHLKAKGVVAVFHHGGIRGGLRRLGDLLLAGAPGFQGPGVDGGPRAMQAVSMGWGGRFQISSLPLGTSELESDSAVVLQPKEQAVAVEGRFPVLLQTPAGNWQSARYQLKQGGKVLDRGELDRFADRYWYRALRTGSATGKLELEVEWKGPKSASLGWKHSWPLKKSSPPKFSLSFPQARGDARKSGSVMGVGDFSRGMAFRWMQNFGAPPSAPVQAGDKIYFGLAGDPEDEERCGLLCLQAVNGAMYWKATSPAPILASPAVFEDKVLAVDREGRLLAWDRETGSSLYQQEPPWPSRGLEFQSPTVHRDRVYLALEGGLVAHSIEDGTRLWQSPWPEALALPPFRRHDGARYQVSEAGPVVVSKLLLTGGPRGCMIVDLQGGEVLWFLSGFCSQPVVDRNGRKLWLVVDGQLRGFESKDRGRRDWQPLFDPVELPGGSAAPPALAGNRLLVAGGDGVLYAFHPDSGRPLWAHQTDPGLVDYSPLSRGQGHILAGPLAAATEVLLAGTDGHLRVLNSDSGKLLQSIDLGLPLETLSLAPDGLIFCRAAGSALISISANP
ncbi:MAG: hypothetical protein DWQ01_21305 [Planctomycetota bacterium]|nr:MAG: hypothetical protein DWQ01_21305 [Planctomycetota bacterium]